MARIELQDKIGIVFNEEEHTYYNPTTGEYLSGITEMLGRQLFPDMYTGIPKAIMNAAAEYGTGVHKSLEDFDYSWINDGSQELEDYIRLCKENGLVHEASEFTVHDGTGSHWASNIDKIFRTGDDSFSIADIKTYGQMTKDKLLKSSYQCSLYAYFLEQTVKGAHVDKLYIIHLRNKPKSDGTFDHISEIIEVERIPSEVCKALLDADLAGEQFVNPYVDEVPEYITSQEARLRELIKEKADIEEELNSIKATILDNMESSGQSSWQTEGGMKITLKQPSTRVSFDVKKYKADHPDLDLTPYEKTSQVASSLTIKV